ncbi:hypothetical protein GCM10010218_44610 [Streptomyces mashuensis]|uniref:Uncharacterized protein n=1 Tax=Streptomyces mashuensis TaxID=33904 RepID=A0A919EEK1_9ACTN|nr:hypothetical protein GCM10010218_44610 [Streptomyces mashuensis]
MFDERLPGGGDDALTVAHGVGAQTGLRGGDHGGSLLGERSGNRGGPPRFGTNAVVNGEDLPGYFWTI